VAPECELKGNYQEHNLQTVFVALRAINIPYSAIRVGFAHVCAMTGLRGRWETLCEQPLTICDTGHNSHGIQYVARQLKELSNPHVWIVFGMVNDKDTDVVMRLLPRGEKYHYIFTRPNTQRARSAEEMLALWGKEGVAIENPREAILYAQEHASDEDAIFIGGSNYLVSDAISRFTY
jgi:dihydrofolate synthase/folylpolyglutamate synthase